MLFFLSLFYYLTRARSAVLIEIEYKKCFIESVKCNHTDFAKYFQNNFFPFQDLNEFSDDINEKNN